MCRRARREFRRVVSLSDFDDGKMTLMIVSTYYLVMYVLSIMRCTLWKVRCTSLSTIPTS